jgi:hypothetical protein
MTQILPYALFLLCPLSMGVMMWVMMRGTLGRDRTQQAADPRLDRLERDLQELKTADREYDPGRLNVP